MWADSRTGFFFMEPKFYLKLTRSGHLAVTVTPRWPEAWLLGPCEEQILGARVALQRQRSVRRAFSHPSCRCWWLVPNDMDIVYSCYGVLFWEQGWEKRLVCVQCVTHFIFILSFYLWLAEPIQAEPQPQNANGILWNVSNRKQWFQRKLTVVVANNKLWALNRSKP